MYAKGVIRPPVCPSQLSWAAASGTNKKKKSAAATTGRLEKCRVDLSTRTSRDQSFPAITAILAAYYAQKENG